jgi:hypothetical protein
VSTTSPGWYPDPLGGSGERWWDGDGWTDRVRTPDLGAAASGRYGAEAEDQPGTADVWAGVHGRSRDGSYGNPDYGTGARAADREPPRVALGEGVRLSHAAEEKIVAAVQDSHRGRAAAKRIGVVAVVLGALVIVNFTAAAAWRDNAEAERDNAAAEREAAAAWRDKADAERASAEMQERALNDRLAEVAGEKAQEQDLRRQIEILLVEATLVGDELIQCMKYQAQVEQGFTRLAQGYVPTDWNQYYQFLSDVSNYCRTAIDGHRQIVDTLRRLG